MDNHFFAVIIFSCVFCLILGIIIGSYIKHTPSKPTYSERLKMFYEALEKAGYDKKYFPISKYNCVKSLKENYNHLYNVLMNDIINKLEGKNNNNGT
jgi:hypothetical protein